MTAALQDAALLVVAAALVAAAAALIATGRLLAALPVLLDLLLAASLLRLAEQPTPLQLAGTALLVGVKRLAAIGISAADGSRSVTAERPHVLARPCTSLTRSTRGAP